MDPSVENNVNKTDNAVFVKFPQSGCCLPIMYALALNTAQLNTP
jgi:hypothetical protein